MKKDEKKPIIVCIDDDQQLIDTMESVLSANFPEYDVVPYLSGDDAIKGVERLSEEGREVVLSIADLKMDGISGIEYLSRARKVYPEMARIILTGFPDLDSAIMGIRSKIDDYLEKPLSIKELVKTLKGHIDNYNLRQENRRLNEMIKEQFLYLSDIMDIAFGRLDTLIRRLISGNDREETIKGIRNARENITILSRASSIFTLSSPEDFFDVISVRGLIGESRRYVERGEGLGLLNERGQKLKVVELEEGLSFMGNQMLMRIVLERVLHNACRYGRKGGLVSITVRGPKYISSMKKGLESIPRKVELLLKKNFLAISVFNDGLLTRENWSGILAGLSGKRIKGHPIKGLGLVISRNYLRLMGGEIFPEGVPDRSGVTIHLLLPIHGK